MLFLLFFILLLISTAILWTLGASFFTFQDSFWEIVDYNKAYYAAISALERAELVLRYRTPGFQGSGGWIDSSEIETIDKRHFWYFSGFDKGGSEWIITSRTKSIPKKGEGNVDWMFLSGDALNFNALNYLDREEIYFDMDNTQNNKAYTWTSSTVRLAKYFTGLIRLPLFLSGSFGPLKDGEHWNDDDNYPVDIGNDRIKNDAIVQWEFWGSYNNNEFTIYPTNKIDYQLNPNIIEKEDSVIREKRINKNEVLTFKDEYWPFQTAGISKNELSGLTVISNSENTIKTKKFTEIISDKDSFKNLVFRFSLLNLLYAEQNQIYPYLEYQWNFDNEVADRFYYVNVTGKYKDYIVKMLVKKPTSKASILGSFTVIF